MSQGIPDCRQELEKAVAQLNVSDHLKKIIGQIVLSNYGRGRFHYYLKHVGCDPTWSYVHQVMTIYEELNPYVSKVMAGEDEVWDELFGKMQQWAYRFLLSHNFFPTKETLDLAISYASEAGGTLIQSRFPYDTAVFDAWAIQLVRNVCRKNIREATSSSHVPDNKMSELNEDLVNDERFSIEEWMEKGYDVNEAIKQLNPREQAVIRGFLMGMSVEEIAKQLNLKPGNVYKIKHEAIRKLRKILGLDGYNNG
ncbi:MAG: sigma-70 family RNA polymerase sigma factor [Anaerolineae bacterium]|nr:sigma-70 family RNA polymerase sigma factor [Anaerolineae bacterium]